MDTKEQGTNFSDQSDVAWGIVKKLDPFDPQSNTNRIIPKKAKSLRAFTSIFLVIMVVVALGILINRGHICILK